MDKVSGDIRVCFEILRNTVTKKIDSLRPFLPQESSSLNFHDSRITLDAADLQEPDLKITYDEVHNVMLEMFESKIVKIVKKLPRSHLILLETIYYHYEQEQR